MSFDDKKKTHYGMVANPQKNRIVSYGGGTFHTHGEGIFL